LCQQWYMSGKDDMSMVNMSCHDTSRDDTVTNVLVKCPSNCPLTQSVSTTQFPEMVLAYIHVHSIYSSLWHSLSNDYVYDGLTSRL